MKTKGIICLLLCFIGLIAFCGCKNDGENIVSQTDTHTGIYSEIAVSELEDYVIIYSSDEGSKGLDDAVDNLVETVNAQFGIMLEVRDDYIKKSEGYVERDTEIIVGATNRSLGENILSEIEKADDYLLRLQDKKLVVGGITSDSTYKAVEALIDILLESNRELFFTTDDNVMFYGEYRLDDMILNGASISEYDIVFQSGAAYKKAAELIRDAICRSTGYLLDTRSAGKTAPQGKNILVGNTPAVAPEAINLENEYWLGMKGECFYVYASTSVALYESVSDLCNAICASNGILEIEAGINKISANALSTMSFNVNWDTSDSTRIKNVLDTIEKYRPDTFGVQEATGSWLSILNENLGDEYACVGEGRYPYGDNEYNAIFYKKDKFTVVDSGTKWMSSTPDVAGSKLSGAVYPRIFTYVVLRVNETGKQLIHVNTHTDHVNNNLVRLEQVKIMTSFLTSRYGDIPTAITGDFNDTVDCPSIQYILSEKFENSSDIAFISESTPTFKQTTIDYAFLSEGDFLVYEYDVITDTYDGSYASDHRAVIVRYKIL